jgi:phosphate transport system substrate-binding protein
MNAVGLAFLVAVSLALFAGSAFADPIHGAGSTFASPVIGQWSEAHLKDRAGGDDIELMGAGIDYEPVGSIGGILRLSDPDPAIKALNPGFALPDLTIVVVHRTDDSGSTFHWTSFLSRASPEWKSRYGAATLIDWPVGVAAVRSAGMAQAVRETKGAISYIEYGQVRRASLIYASVENRTGKSVRPDTSAFAAAAAETQWSADNGFFIAPIDAAGGNAYPVTAVTFALLRQEPLNERAMWFFNFALEKGATDAEALGYAALPPALVDQVKAYWMAELGFGK